MSKFYFAFSLVYDESHIHSLSVTLIFLSIGFIFYFYFHIKKTNKQTFCPCLSIPHLQMKFPFQSLIAKTHFGALIILLLKVIPVIY